jgi:hypothetical protein
MQPDFPCCIAGRDRWLENLTGPVSEVLGDSRDVILKRGFKYRSMLPRKFTAATAAVRPGIVASANDLHGSHFE